VSRRPRRGWTWRRDPLPGWRVPLAWLLWLLWLALLAALGAFPPPEKAQASRARRARPPHRVITRRRQ